MPNPPTTPEDYRELWNENARHHPNVPMIPDSLTDDELRYKLEAQLLEWAKGYGVTLDTDQKHALLYGVIPDQLSLIRQDRAALLERIVAPYYAEDLHTYDYDGIAQSVLDTIKKDVGGKQDE